MKSLSVKTRSTYFGQKIDKIDFFPQNKINFCNANLNIAREVFVFKKSVVAISHIKKKLRKNATYTLASFAYFLNYNSVKSKYLRIYFVSLFCAAQYLGKGTVLSAKF